MLRFIKKILIVFTIPIIVFFINYYHNSKGYFNKNSKYLNEVVNHLNEGKNLEINDEYNGEKLTEIRIKNFKAKEIDTLVIGSSLVMNFGIALERIATNFFIYGANLNHYNSIVSDLIKKDVKLNYVIIDVNEFLFQSKKITTEKVEKFDIGLKDKFIKGFSLKELIFSLNPFKFNVIEDYKNANNLVLFFDGSAVQKKEYFERDKDSAFKNSRLLKRRILMNKNLKSYNFDKNQFELFIKDILKFSCRISFYITPQPPEIYDDYKVYYENIEHQIINFSKDKPIDIVGSFNPNTLDIKFDDFLDARHLSLDAIKKIYSSKY